MSRKRNAVPAPSPEEIHLVSVVAAAPLDDAPRLAYADWLSAQGGAMAERAERIRLQCELARLGPGDEADARAEAIDDRLRALLPAEAAWLDAIAARLPGLEVYELGLRFERGFVEHAKMALRTFLASADMLFRELPLLGHLTLETPFEPLAEIEALLARPDLSRLTHLKIAGNRVASSHLGDEGAALFAGARHLAGLRGLRLHWCGVGDEGAAALAASAGLSGLRSLDLSRNKIGPKGAQALARAAAFPGLTELRLAENRVKATGAKALATTTLGSLEWLDLSENQLDDKAALSLSKLPPSVKTLALFRTKLGPAAVSALCARFGERVLLSGDPGG